MEPRRKRVLVVDDEEDLTWSISKHLAKDVDKYELICVNSGGKALEVLSQLPVDLVISDIRMPEITGLELLTKIKEIYPATKVVIMTAYGSSEVQAEANKLGCLKYIEKPFEINEIRQLIIGSIQEKRGFEGTISEFQLTDLIQMNCLGRMTTALYVEHGGTRGEIYFDEGNIVHAQVDDLEGEEAFFEILSWEGGNFSVEREKSPEKETIIKGWQSILLEGMKRLDESSPSYQVEKEADRKKRLQKIDALLQNLINIKGMILASVFDPEGFPMASKVHPSKEENYDMVELAPTFSRMIKQVENHGEDLKLNELKDFVFEFENTLIKVTRFPGRKQFLVIMAEIKNNLGVLRMEAKKSLHELVKHI